MVYWVPTYCWWSKGVTEKIEDWEKMSRGVFLIYSLVLLTSAIIILSQSPFSSALEELF